MQSILVKVLDRVEFVANILKFIDSNGPNLLVLRVRA